MKYVRYFLISALCGSGFAIGLIALIWLTGNNLLDNRIDAIHESIGMSCHELHREAYLFAMEDIGNIIESGARGQDWISKITVSQKIYIDQTERHLQQCLKLELAASWLNYSWPNLPEIQQTYSHLRQFTNLHGHDGATLQKLKPYALEKLKYHHKNMQTIQPVK